jgi:ribosomal protein S5
MATIDALKQLRSAEQVASMRGIELPAGRREPELAGSAR